jgi:hypothetical protein
MDIATLGSSVDERASTTELLARIKIAVAVANDAEKKAEGAKKEFTSTTAVGRARATSLRLPLIHSASIPGPIRSIARKSGSRRMRYSG